MGRELKRVPLDFNYPLNQVWYGYLISGCYSDVKNGCDRCKEFARHKNIPITDYECPDYRKYFNLDPPEGNGYQLWETTSEGSPQSPVFESLEQLCEWCETNATTFADFRATKEEWKQMLANDNVIHREGNIIFT